MKKLFFAALAVAAACFSGCVVLSVAPFYTEKDLTFDPALLGAWRDVQATNNLWVFEKEDTNVYRLTLVDGDNKNLTHARLFKLDGHLFLDMVTPKVDLKENGKQMFPPPIPAHTIARVEQITPSLRVALLNFEWLGEYLTNNPAAIRHYMWKEDANEKGKGFPILTAETANLQKFILQHYADKNAWREETGFMRDPDKLL